MNTNYRKLISKDLEIIRSIKTYFTPFERSLFDLLEKETFSEEEVVGTFPERAISVAAESRDVVYDSEKKSPSKEEDYIDSVEFELELPKGLVYEVSRLLNFLDSKFSKVTIKVTATGGELSKSEYENSVKEALRQIESFNRKSSPG